MNRTVFIYGLFCPIEKQIKYIGSTVDLRFRTNAHYSNCGSQGIQKTLWVEKLRKKNLRFEVITIDETTEQQRDYWEKFYIELFKSWGFNLLNSKTYYNAKEKKERWELQKKYITRKNKKNRA